MRSVRIFVQRRRGPNPGIRRVRRLVTPSVGRSPSNDRITTVSKWERSVHLAYVTGKNPIGPDPIEWLIGPIWFN